MRGRPPLMLKVLDSVNFTTKPSRRLIAWIFVAGTACVGSSGEGSRDESAASAEHDAGLDTGLAIATEPSVPVEPGAEVQSDTDQMGRVVRDSVDQLIMLLTSVQGEFVEHIPVVGGFEGDKTVFRRLLLLADAGHAHSIIPLLVDCMGKRTPAMATRNGHPVSVGMMCYSALISMAYHEGDTESNSGGWAGVITVDATPAELESAQEAWRTVVAAGRYNLT